METNTGNERLTSLLVIAVVVGALFALMSTEYGGSVAANGFVAGTVAFVAAYGGQVLFD